MVLGKDGSGMAFVPTGVKTDMPPWKAGWWRTTLFLVQLTVEHPETGELFTESLRKEYHEPIGLDEQESAKRHLRIWAEEKARLVGLKAGTA